jgi:hypothetical protein
MPEDTTVQFFVIWALALTAIVNFLTNLWTIFSGPSKRNAATLAEHATTLSRIETRLQSVELKQASLPTTEGMHQLELSMEQMRGEMKTMAVQMKGQTEIMERLEAIVGRHDNHLMQGR